MESISGKYTGKASSNAVRTGDAASGEATASSGDGEPPDTFAGLLKMIDMLSHFSMDHLRSGPAGDVPDAPPRISPPMF